ncbi:PilZ domain-containing protein [Dechloromonas sp. CZR5]|uniref:PilZ domain-containing protein n=1 Tax=Dechloromonas sp. CZR5 TaxID=2608630 RepID=UPI00123CC9EC|nr:PilZ domain-containing protein [Dechloromonas sp. CZR5]
MLDQRRHQRIRFGTPQTISIGFGGQAGKGVIENLSLSGLMLRTPMPLEIAHNIGCEFSVFDSPVIDVPAVVVSRVCDLYGVRFQQGPISQIVIEDAINAALASGKASILSVHELGRCKTMRITGGLSAVLRSDFMHALTRMGVDEIDLEGVTAVEQAGLALCLVATKRHGVTLGAQSVCFAEAWAQAMAAPGSIERLEVDG